MTHIAIKVGIPRGMYFYKYFPLTEKFLTELGAEVVPSSKTTKEILDEGVRCSIDDVCLPVKVYHGHANALKSKVDMMLIPRLTSVSKKEYICPTVGGLPEMIRYSMSGLPPLINVEVNLFANERAKMKTFYQIAHAIGISNPFRINAAAKKAMGIHSYFKNEVYSGQLPDRIIDWQPVKKVNEKLKLGVIAHPYLLYDSFINMNLFDKLDRHHMRYITPDMIDGHIIDERCLELPKRMFWSSGKALIGSMLYMMDRSDISGILFITAFGCGVDSLIGDYMNKTLQKSYKKPYLILNIDEHTGSACFDTRLEAFIDLF